MPPAAVTSLGAVRVPQPPEVSGVRVKLIVSPTTGAAAGVVTVAVRTFGTTPPPVLSTTVWGAIAVPPVATTTLLLAACVITAVPERPLSASVTLMVQVPTTAVPT